MFVFLLAPQKEVVVHRTPFREITWEHSPLTTRLEDIQEGAEDIVLIDGSGSCLLAYSGKYRTDFLKLFTGNITWVYTSLHIFVLIKPYKEVYMMEKILNSY